MTWIDVLSFARGPLFQAALLVFIAGMAYRLVRVIFLGWSPDRVKPKGSKAGGVVMTFLKSIIIWNIYNYCSHEKN